MNYIVLCNTKYYIFKKSTIIDLFAYIRAMDLLFVILGSLLLIVGIVGCFVPVIPGPIIAYFALLVLKFTDGNELSNRWLWIFGALAITVSLIDNIIPVYATKKYGGSRAGVIGTFVGLVIGLLFFPPFGFIFGPFLGAFAAELYIQKSEIKLALRAAYGSLIGVLAGSFLKLALVLWMSYIFYIAL
jgi:uncharacterized protein YqgC (DUF456 family)